MKIGIFADSLRLPVRDGLNTALDLGVSNFQLFTSPFEFAVSDAFVPWKMSKAARQDFRRYYTDLGMTLSATCADFGIGFVDAEKNVGMIPRMYEQIDHAVDLGTAILTTHIGVVPEVENAVWDTLRSALTTIGKYAEEHGVVLAAETGPESGPVLRALLDSLDTQGIRVNFDPANLTMAGFDLDEALDALMPYIVHTHAKDGMRDPELWAKGQWNEVPLGQGDVDWPAYLRRLQAGGYDGVFCIEREIGNDPIADVAHAVRFLQQLACEISD